MQWINFYIFYEFASRHEIENMQAGCAYVPCYVHTFPHFVRHYSCESFSCINYLNCSQIKKAFKQTFCFADVAEKVLDRCTERKKYVYEFLEDFKPLSLPCCQGRKHDDIESRLQNENDHWGPKHFERSNHPLAIMVSYDDDTSCMLSYHITCNMIF